MNIPRLSLRMWAFTWVLFHLLTVPSRCMSIDTKVCVCVCVCACACVRVSERETNIWLAIRWVGFGVSLCVEAILGWTGKSTHYTPQCGCSGPLKIFSLLWQPLSSLAFGTPAAILEQHRSPTGGTEIRTLPWLHANQWPHLALNVFLLMVKATHESGHNDPVT